MAAGPAPLQNLRFCLITQKQKHLPLTLKEWEAAFDCETGCLIDSSKIIRKIRHGGIESSIRAEVWPFLLNFYALESSEVERESERLSKREAYNELKRRCMVARDKIMCGNCNASLVPSEETLLTLYVDEDESQSSEFQNCNMAFNGVKPAKHKSWEPQSKLSAVTIKEFNTWQHIIRRDAVRMSPEWLSYASCQASVTKKVANQLAMDVGLNVDEHLEPALKHHAARLVAILDAYALYDPETGYCQGMSDLVSPFVALLDEDYQAFWCFAHFMSTVRHNFRLDEEGIQKQLHVVSKILKLSDAQLYQHLLSINAAQCIFVYRMILVLMKRELSFEQTLVFWEILWADRMAGRLGKVKILCTKGRSTPPSDDLLLYVVAAAIQQKRVPILEDCWSMDDVLRECNCMSGNLDLWALLGTARMLLASLHRRVTA